MNRTPMEMFDHYAAVTRRLGSDGLLLGGYARDGNANIMTIGWGQLGIIWGMPIWTVLVRPSRYTYDCIEHSGAFSVNVPTATMAGACSVCGTLSGRDIDKFAETALTAAKAGSVDAPIVAECPIVYECQVVHHNDVIPKHLVQSIVDDYYPEGDFHRVYFGKVIAAEAAADAAGLLAD